MTPAALRDVMRRHGIHPGRRLGQHFLLDPGVLRRIVAAAEIAPGTPVVEVGPGLGVLTRELTASGGRVTAIELDRSLRPALLEVLGAEPASGAASHWAGREVDRVNATTRVIWADAVRVPWAILAAEEPGPWRLCSNLPYYITGPFLAAFLEGGLPWSTAVLLVQAEAAARLKAVPGTKAYGAFTCLVAYHAEVERLFSVARGAFLPPPRVDSAVVRLRRRSRPPTPAPRQRLRAVVRAAFAQRRKTLRNALRSGLDVSSAALDEALAVSAIDGARRAETLTLDEFGRLALALGALASVD